MNSRVMEVAIVVETNAQHANAESVQICFTNENFFLI